jgi:hypothetical protein
MDEIIKKLNEHDQQFDRLIEVVIDNQDRLRRVEQNMATKKETNEIMNILDELVGLGSTVKA